MTGVAGRRWLGETDGVLAVVRLIAVPLFLAAEQLVDHPAQNTAPFFPLLALTGAYALAVLLAGLRGRRLLDPGVLATIDLVLISALVATSGGPFSQLRYAFFILPIGAALGLRPRATAAASAAIVAAYGLIALTFPGETVRPDAVGFELTQLLFLAWMGGAATALSALLARRAREIGALAEARTTLAAERGRLVAQALDAEDRARRGLAEALHDEALQNLLAARHELGVADPRLEVVVGAVDETVAQLRDAVFDLHPYLLEQADLGVALEAVAERAAARGGFLVQLDAEPEALGHHDALLFSIGRELIANAATHAAASKLWVALRRADDGVVLLVSDDGTGIDVERAARAPREGHIGLASCAERATAVDGRLTFGPGPDGVGTLVRVWLPERDGALQPLA